MSRLSRIVLISIFLCLSAVAQDAPEPGLNEKTLSGLKWRSIGPALMAGRIADIAIDPSDRSTWYVGVGSGGIFKTVNRGTTWTPIFEDQGSYSIGCITIDPNNPLTIWVGTGENVGGRHVGYGDGVYRSLDGGQTWQNMGLANSEHIGNILVDPRDSNVIYVAAQGPLWSGGGDRGLFKSTDGGQSWNKILGGGEFTGVNEVHFDPRNPDILFAATHQRVRSVAALMNGGPESGIHKSDDGGQTWREITNGIPKEDKGKIGLAVSPANPDIVYATIELAQRKGGLWRSTDGGESFEKRSDEVYSGTGPHYYQEIFASPHDEDVVYQVAPGLYTTHDGGKTVTRVENPTVHGDYHAMAFDPNDPDYLIIGSDGGVYESFDGAESWKFMPNLPITQFYKVAVDYDLPFYNVYGGTQDNNTQGGPSRTTNVNGIRNSDWFITVFADGHQPAVDPTNPDIVYSEWQQGNLVRYDRTTGEVVYIKPQPAEDEPSDRWNWDAPILISPHDPARLYFASQRVWRSDDRGNDWTAISGDLSHGKERLLEPMMGRQWSWDSAWDTFAMSQYGTITSLSESPLVEGLLYAGTDDGRIHVSADGGGSWSEISDLPGVPEGYFVNDIKADLHDADTVYVVVDDHKSGDFSPYVLKSNNRGRSWRSISANLPDRHIVWRLVQDHAKPGLMFVGTEFGVFFTVDGGGRWTKLAGGAPNIPFRDLAIQKRENDLVGATFGRSFYILDDYSPLREISAESLAADTALFPVRDAWWYIPSRPLGDFEENGKSSQGDQFFVAPNPPFGAVVTYYLPEDIQTAKQARREREQAIEKEGGNTPFHGWDALREESVEEDPAVVLTVRDANGQVIRTIEGPVTAGFHRVAWDLRYPRSSPWTEDPSEQYIRIGAPLVAPGTYSVSLATRRNGSLQDSGQSRSFEVKLLHQNALATASAEEVIAFQLRTDALSRQSAGAQSAIATALKEIAAIKQTFPRSAAPESLRAEARRIELELNALQVLIAGDPNRSLANAQGPMSITARMQAAQYGTSLATHGPTPNHERSLEIAENLFSGVKERLDKVMGHDLPALRAALDRAGVPWTPGRGVPAGG